MREIRVGSLRYGKKLTLGLFFLGGLLILALLVPRIGAHDKEAAGCPHLSQASGGGCPYMARAEGSGCPHSGATKGSGCPYLAEAKGCLHILKYSLELDEEQMESLREIQGKFMEKSAGLKKKIRETGSALDVMFRDSDVSAQEVSAKHETLSGLKEELEKMALDLRLQIRKDLTKDQLHQIPEGCWHGILAFGYGDVWSGHPGCKCPYKSNPSDVST